MLHELGVHADGGKAGEGVDLVDEHPAGVLFHKEIAPCQTLAVQCGVGHGGVGLYLVQLGLRQMCRDDGLAHTVLVLIIIGVELCTGKNLTGTGGNSGVRTDDGALHFLSVHKGLKHHLAVVFQRKGDGGLQLLLIGHLGDAHTGTCVGGLDEHRPAQLLFHTGANALQILLDLPTVGGYPLGVGHTVGLKQGVGHSLVHAHRACQHAAAHISDACQLQQTLHGAVLAPQAVEHRDHHVKVHLFHPAVRGKQDHAVVGAVRADHAGHIAGQLFPAAIGHLFRRGLGIEPAALLGDAHGEHLVFAAVDVADKVAHRDTADLMFAGHTAKQQSHAHFICRLHDISLLFIKPR